MCWISPKIPRASQGLTLTGKIALPSSRASTSSAKHHLEAIQSGRQQRDHRLALAQLLIERLLPVGTGLDAALDVEVQEQRGMALGFEPALHVLGSDAVGAAVADEYRGHLTEAAPTSSAPLPHARLRLE